MTSPAKFSKKRIPLGRKQISVAEEIDSHHSSEDSSESIGKESNEESKSNN